ncbi:kinase-like domain-containing protein [Rhizophagus clarus]|uniref:Kinase-like domain-containing protein n=1 Tax=Rhizophagus clarus TaxID=94130 RepID=A0A8H3MCS0_9GLOM|nr:kinase-like domain-containing protein [Rhizophagus clarus]
MLISYDETHSLIDKLILNEELKNYYKKYGLCNTCKQPMTYTTFYCQPCHSKYFQSNFKNWTSGNHDVDEFIQKAQLNAKSRLQVIEWVEYDKFEDIEYLAKGGFGTTFKAIWKDGFMFWDYENYQWIKNGKTKVALKCLHDSHDITADFFKEVETSILVEDDVWVVRCFGITKDPITNKFMMRIDSS